MTAPSGIISHLMGGRKKIMEGQQLPFRGHNPECSQIITLTSQCPECTAQHTQVHGRLKNVFSLLSYAQLKGNYKFCGTDSKK